MKNFLVVFAFASFFFSCKSSQYLQNQNEGLTPLTLDTITALGLANRLPLLQLFLEKKITAVKAVPGKSTTTVTPEGTVFRTIYNPASDTLIADTLTAGVVLAAKQNQKLGLVLQVGFEPDASVANKKFLMFAINNGAYQLVLEGDAEKPYISYGGEKFFVAEGGDSGLLFFLIEEEKDALGNTRKITGKKKK